MHYGVMIWETFCKKVTKITTVTTKGVSTCKLHLVTQFATHTLLRRTWRYADNAVAIDMYKLIMVHYQD